MSALPKLDAARERTAGPSARETLSHLARSREVVMVLVVVAAAAVTSVLSPYFLSPNNLRAMLIGLVPTAIITTGMAILLVSGGFDLSVGSVMALAGTVVGWLMLRGLSIPVAVGVVLLLGLAIGLVNGAVVTRLGVNPLIATLGMMSIARGIALVLTEGYSVTGLPKAFGWAGRTDVGGIPVMVIVLLAVVLLADFGLRKSRFLRQVYYIGGNERAARLSGIRVDEIRIFTYVLTSVLAALAGILLASRLMAGTPTAGMGLELQAIAAAVLGGASLSGGEGSVLGAVLGVVFVAIIANALTLLAVSIYWQGVVAGTILILAVSLDMVAQRRRA